MKNASPTEEVKTWTTNQVVLATLFVVLVFLSFALLYRLREVIFLLAMAIVIGTAIRPTVEWLHRRNISRSVGIIGIYIVLACVIVGVLALLVPLIADQGTQLIQQIPQNYETVRQAMLGSDSRLLQNLGLRIPPRLDFFLNNNNPTTEEMFSQVNQTFLYTNLIMKSVLSVLAIFLLAFYWTQDGKLAIRALLQFIPQPRRKGAREFIYLAEMKIGAYVRGQGLLCLIVAVMAFIAYTIIGLPFALVLGVIAGFMEMIPVFGPVLGAIPALLVALSLEPQKAIWVVVVSGLIQMMENVWLVPRIMKSSMGVNPIVIILSLVTFGSVLGFAGAVLAIPLAAMIQLILDRIILSPERPNNDHAEIAEEQLPFLEESQKEIDEIVQKTASSSNGQEHPSRVEQAELQTIIQELQQLLQDMKAQEDAAEEPA